MAGTRIKKNDMVKILVGVHKGKTGKVTEIYPNRQKVTVEGVGKIKRHIKPSQLNPQGGTKDIQVPLHISKVALLDTNSKPTRIGYQFNKTGTKVRIAKTTRKEIK